MTSHLTPASLRPPLADLRMSRIRRNSRSRGDVFSDWYTIKHTVLNDHRVDSVGGIPAWSNRLEPKGTM